MIRLRIDVLENQIEFEDFIKMFDHIFSHSLNNINFVDLYQTNQTEFITYFLKYLTKSNYFQIMRSKYENTFNTKSFELIVKKFMEHNYKYIDFSNIPKCGSYQEFLNRFLFDEFKFTDKELFLTSLEFKQYLERDLNMLINMNIFNDVESQIFWRNCAQYQKLTCTFIQKHYIKFKEPELAYLLKIGNNQLYSCTGNIVTHILQSAKLFENNIRN